MKTKTEAQKRLKTLLEEIGTIRKGVEAKGGKWEQADLQTYEAKLGEADKLKMTVELEGREEELRDWAHSGNGYSAVRSSFNLDLEDDGEESDAIKATKELEEAYWRQAGPTEGTAEGITIDRATKKLVATNKAGERRLAMLSSGAYKDALNYYIRNAWKREFQMKAVAVKVLQSGQDAAGGAWVAPDMRAEIVKKEATMAAIRPNARAFTVGSDLVSFPKVEYTTDDRYTSGVRFSWTAEAPSADISEATNPVAGRENIPVHTATAAIILTRQNMEDAQFDVLGLCSDLLGESFVLGEEDSFITGDGVGKPQGFQNHPLASTAHASGGMQVLSGSAGALAWGDSTTGIVGTEASLPPQYEGNAAWYGAKASYAAVRALQDTTNRPLWIDTDYFPNQRMGYPPVLIGYPIRKSQFMPAIGAANKPLAFGDMQSYWIADRVGITVEVLREVRALRDEVILYARKRLGGQLVQPWRLKLLKSNNA